MGGGNEDEAQDEDDDDDLDYPFSRVLFEVTNDCQL